VDKPLLHSTFRGYTKVVGRGRLVYYRILHLLTADDAPYARPVRVGDTTLPRSGRVVMSSMIVGAAQQGPISTSVLYRGRAALDIKRMIPAPRWITHLT
jgi:hypothetical protein